MEITQEKYMLNLMVIHKEKAIQCCDRERVGVEGETPQALYCLPAHQDEKYIQGCSQLFD